MLRGKGNESIMIYQKTSFGQFCNDEGVHIDLRKDWEVKVEVEPPALIEEGNLTGKKVK